MSEEGAGKAILDSAALGFVLGRAVLAERADDEKHGDVSWDEREWDVPTSFWQTFDGGEESLQDWERGLFSRIMPGPKGLSPIKLTGVHFLADSLQVLISPSETAGGDAAGKERRRTGGRPPQPWWDDLWCAVWGLIHQGDFKPKNIAEVERAMLTWATMQEHDLSEAAVKPKARKLFAAYKGEITNFLAG